MTGRSGNTLYAIGLVSPLQITGEGRIDLFQHFCQFPGQRSVHGKTLEIFRESKIKAVVLRFILENDRPAQLIEALQSGLVQPFFHTIEKDHPLSDGYLDSVVSEKVKKINKHGRL